MKTQKHLKKLLTLTFAVTLLFGVLAIVSYATEAEDYGTLAYQWDVSGFSSDDVAAKLYSSDSDSYTLVIEGSGRMLASWSDGEYAPWYQYRNNITEVVIKEGITTIGNYAFYDMNNIESIVIPDSVSSVGTYSFAKCSDLKRVYVGTGVTSFNSFAFADSTGITEVHISDIGAWSKITFINEQANPLSVSGKLYLNGEHITDIVIPDSITKIGSYTFVNSDITSITLGTKTYTAGTNAFYGCNSLSVVKISNTTLAKECKTVDKFGYLLAKASTVALSPNITSIGTYIKSNFTYIYSISNTDIDGNASAYNLYSMHSHAEDSDRWKALYVSPTSSMLGFSGYECSLCGIRKGSELPCVEIAGNLTSANLTVGSDLTINIFADLYVTGAYPQVRFTMNDTVSVVSGTLDSATNKYRFSFEGVAPQHMTDSVKAELLINGEVVSAVDNCGVKAYAKALLSCSAEELNLNNEEYSAICTLVCDMLEYGAQAQIYRGYKTDELANDGINGASEYTEIESTDYGFKKLAEAEGVTFIAANLRFDHANQLYFRFSAPDSEKVTLKVVQNGSVAVYNADDLVMSNGSYIFYTEDILATGFDDVYNVVLCYDEIEIQELSYSVRSYVYNKQNQTDENGDLTPIAKLARATYKYGTSALKYFSLIKG